MLDEPLLVSSPVNVRYLTGFSSSNAALLVEPDGARLCTDFRYVEAARGVPGVDLVELPRNLYPALAGLLSSRVGFESAHVSYERYEALAGGDAELVPRQGLVEAMRETKDDGELELISRAAAITDEAYTRLAGEAFVGKRERDLAWRLEEFLHELGGDGPSFEIIVASGPNAALPHARPTEHGGDGDR